MTGPRASRPPVHCSYYGVSRRTGASARRTAHTRAPHIHTGHCPGEGYTPCLRIHWTSRMESPRQGKKKIGQRFRLVSDWQAPVYISIIHTVNGPGLSWPGTATNPDQMGTLVTRGHGSLDTRHAAAAMLHPMSHSWAGSRVSPARRLSSCPRPRPPLAKCYKTLTDLKANLSSQHYPSDFLDYVRYVFRKQVTFGSTSSLGIAREYFAKKKLGWASYNFIIFPAIWKNIFKSNEKISLHR